MNTEIKFRVWNGTEMVYDVTVGKFGTFYVNPMSKGNGLDENDSASLSPFNTRYPDSTPVMQYTGFHDKKGNEIYKGDIIKMKGSPNPYFYEVRFEDAAFVCYHANNNWGKWGVLYRMFDCDFLNMDFEVIGNIYQNPEFISHRAVGG